MGARSTMAETADGGEAIGESGGFLQVSGMRYTIDTSIESSVEVDENGMFVSCAGARRVKDVEVLQPDGSYAPLDPNATYTLASHNYLIREGGDGFNMFMDNNAVVEEGTVRLPYPHRLYQRGLRRRYRKRLRGYAESDNS